MACSPESTKSSAQQDSATAEPLPQAIVIKGLSIEMTIDDALKVTNERLSEAIGSKYVIGKPQPGIFGGEAPKGFVLTPSNEGRSDVEKGFANFASMVSVSAIPDDFRICADEGRQVYQVVLPAFLTNKLFNTADMQASEFAQEIVNNYHIPSMSPFSFEIGDMLFSGWEYSSPHGVRVRVFDDKAIELWRIPKQSARSFD